MSYNSVFRSLQEVFPQVDKRVLKAVAIEHSKDTDAAVECILFEVLPNLQRPSESHRTPTDSQDDKHLIVGEEEPEVQRVVERAIAGSPSNLGYVDSEDANDIIYTTDAPYGDSKCLNEEPVGSLVLSLHGGDDDDLQTSNCGLKSASLDLPSDHLFLTTGPEELIWMGKKQNVSDVDGSDHGSLGGSGSILGEVCFNDCCNDVSSFNMQDLNELVVGDSSAIYRENHQDQSCVDADSLKMENLVASIPLIPSQEESSNSAECGSLLPNVGNAISDFNMPDLRNPSESVSAEVDFDIEVGNVENGSSSTAVVSHSSQICSIDLLEENIGEAKNNKKTLFLVMESVINKMKELEFQEEVAEQAKREAARGGLDILTKVEDLRQILQHAKEANDMHAGEVYGEKAILATEVRELRSRIQNLSDERDKSLAVLEEMTRILEIRLAAAEEETKTAKQEKLEKERLGRVVLAEQEVAMESVVDMSKSLQRQAEENSKLRDFLMDRGRVVDILQGEIAVICQDVKLLKEKFDEHVPISKSLSSSQTSCILASSSSSIKSLGYDWVPENVEESEAREKTSPARVIVSGDTKKPLDDEWEFFDDEVLLS